MHGLRKQMVPFCVMCVVRCYTKMNQNIQNLSLREEILKLVKTDPEYTTIQGVMDCTIKVIERRIDEMWNRTNYAIDGDGFYQDIKKEILK
jgi:hypothetical protein